MPTTYYALTPTSTAVRTVISTGLAGVHDYPLTTATATKSFTKTVVNGSGVAQPGVSASLVRKSDRLICQTKTTNGSGVVTFARDVTDPNSYEIVVWPYIPSGGAAQYHGVSDEGVPT